jgi:hypothetical protein
MYINNRGPLPTKNQPIGSAQPQPPFIAIFFITFLTTFHETVRFLLLVTAFSHSSIPDRRLLQLTSSFYGLFYRPRA